MTFQEQDKLNLRDSIQQAIQKLDLYITQLRDFKDSENTLLSEKELTDLEIMLNNVKSSKSYLDSVYDTLMGYLFPSSDKNDKAAGIRIPKSLSPRG